MKRLLLLLLWIGFSTAVWAAPGLDIEARIDQKSDPLPFGKPATLILNLSWDEKWPFTPPLADKLELPGLTVIDRFSTSPPNLGAGRDGITYNIVFTRFEPGPATIPPVEFQTPSGMAKSQSLKIVYKGAEAQEGDKPDQLRAPKDVAELSTKDWWIWLAKMIGVTLLVLLVLGAISRRLGFLERWLSPRNRALRQLSKIVKTLEKGSIPAPEATLAMVEIVRLYLQRAYGLMTREATSREIFEQMTMNNRCQNIKPVANAVLEWGDLAKFAQREPTSEQARDMIEHLRAALKAEAGGKKK